MSSRRRDTGRPCVAHNGRATAAQSRSTTLFRKKRPYAALTGLSRRGRSHVRSWCKRISIGSTPMTTRGPALNAIITINPRAWKPRPRWIALCGEQVRVTAAPLHSCHLERQLRHGGHADHGRFADSRGVCPVRGCLRREKTAGSRGANTCESESDGTGDEAARLSVLWAARQGIHTISHARPAAPAAARAPRLPRALPSLARAATPANPSDRRPRLRASLVCVQRAASSAGVESFR